MTNPFRPPSSRVADGVARPGSALRALALGLAADIGGSLLAGLLLSLVYGAVLGGQGASAKEIETAMQNLPVDSWVSLLGMALGTACSAWGGYVCARVARRREFALGAVLALLSILSGLLLGGGQYSLGLNLMLAAAGFLAIMFGVRLGAARNEDERGGAPLDRS